MYVKGTRGKVQDL